MPPLAPWCDASKARVTKPCSASRCAYSAGGLLLDAAAGVDDHDRRVGAVAVEVGGDEDVARHGDVAVLELDGLHRGPPGDGCREITGIERGAAGATGWHEAVVSGVPDEHATSVTAAAVPTSEGRRPFQDAASRVDGFHGHLVSLGGDDSRKPVVPRRQQDLLSHVMADHPYRRRSVVAWAYVQPRRRPRVPGHSSRQDHPAAGGPGKLRSPSRTRGFAAKRSPCSPASAPTITPAWSAATSSGFPTACWTRSRAPCDSTTPKQPTCTT